MSRRLLKRSLEYRQRVRVYAKNLSKRYRLEIAGVFIKDVGLAQKRIFENNETGTKTPYLMLGQKVELRELYFTSGPAKYYIVYDIFDNHIGLVTIWHGTGARGSDDLMRLWGQ